MFKKVGKIGLLKSIQLKPPKAERERIQRVREIEILKWICHLRSIHSYWKDSEAIPFTNT